MINQIICEIEMIKNDIKQVKDDQRKQKEDNLTNLREEIEKLRNEIKILMQQSISSLREETHAENENIRQSIVNHIESTKAQIRQEERNHFIMYQEEITNIKQDIQNLNISQENKVDKRDFINHTNEVQIQRNDDQNEKDIIRREVSQLKQIVNKINNFSFCVDTNSKTFGTNWKITEKLYSDGILNTPEFLNQIKKFKDFNIEIKYPSENFNHIYEQVLNLKRSHESNCTISIFVAKACHKYFKGNTEINSVIIDHSVTKIDEESFKGCSSLSNILIPSSVISIGNSAFEECSTLSNVLIPSLSK